MATVAQTLASGCDFARTGFAPVEEAVLYRASHVTAPPAGLTQLRVMTWNIRFASGRLQFFWDCAGQRYRMSESEVLSGLAGLVAKIGQVNPDVLLLQEAHTQATMTAYIDQVQYLLDHTDLNYGAYASIWRADLIPSDALGRMDLGNAILSRWPLHNAKRHALALIEDQPAYERYFYFHRNVLTADIPDLALSVANIHAAAWAKDDTRKKHIDQFTEILDGLDQAGRLFVAGGDLNTVPRGSQRSDFPDDCPPGTGRFDPPDYTRELAWLDRLYQRYQPAVSLSDFAANPRSFNTAVDGDPARAGREGWDFFWTKKLDYLFTNGRFVGGVVHQDERTGMATLPLSDHAPVVADYLIP